MSTEEALGTKALDEAEIQRLYRRSVTDPEARPGELGAPGGLLYLVAGLADEVLPWGTNVIERDRQLRQFLTTESISTGAIMSVAARNMGFNWQLDGPERSVAIAHEILHNANMGKGWLDFIAKFSIDLMCQDKGSFVEIIRERDSPEAPTLGIQTLDAARCWHTGNPEMPVLYRDRNGKQHRLKWYQVSTAAEMPAPHEQLHGLQYSALSRILRAAQVYRNIQQYMEEKTGGRHNKAIHFVSGANRNEIEAALRIAQESAQGRGQMRYVQPAVLTTMNPNGKIETATLELSTLPDGFDAEEAFKQFLTIVALGLLSDFQEFAPLPGGNLGTSMQSEILHLKARGKGPMLFRKLVEHKLNHSGILPGNVTFRYDEADVDAEEGEAKRKLIRAQGWKTAVEAKALDGAAVRQLMLDAGDISQEIFDALAGRDIEAEEAARAPAPFGGKPRALGDTPTDMQAEGEVVPEEEAPQARKDAISDARSEAEAEFTDRVEAVFSRMRASLRERLGRVDEPDIVRKDDLDTLRKEMSEAVQSVATAIATPPPPQRVIKRVIRDEHGRVAGVEEVTVQEG